MSAYSGFLPNQAVSRRSVFGDCPFADLAFKLNQKEIEERIIRCQEISFIAGKKILVDKVVKKYSFDRAQEGFDPVEFLDCQEMLDVYNYIKQAFSWKAGKYEVVFHIESPDKFKLVDNEYEFNLTPIDIEELEKNKNNLKQDHINIFVGDEHEKYKDVAWNWKNPPLYKKN